MSLGLPLDASHIIAGFQILNILLIMASLGFWMAIAKRIAITRAAYWIGIAGLFLMFPNARQALYYPVTTDTFALMTGLALVWAQVTGRLGVLALFAIVGSFAWQTSSLVGVILLMSNVLVLDTDRRLLLDVPARVSRVVVFLIGFCAALWMGLVGLAYAGRIGLDLVPFANGLEYDPTLRF